MMRASWAEASRSSKFCTQAEPQYFRMCCKELWKQVLCVKQKSKEQTDDDIDTKFKRSHPILM
jgi:hypothetical protein